MDKHNRDHKKDKKEQKISVDKNRDHRTEKDAEGKVQSKKS